MFLFNMNKLPYCHSAPLHPEVIIPWHEGSLTNILGGSLNWTSIPSKREKQTWPFMWFMPQKPELHVSTSSCGLLGLLDSSFQVKFKNRAPIGREQKTLSAFHWLIIELRVKSTHIIACKPKRSDECTIIWDRHHLRFDPNNSMLMKYIATPSLYTCIHKFTTRIPWCLASYHFSVEFFWVPIETSFIHVSVLIWFIYSTHEGKLVRDLQSS